jgi:hypothetical protein
MFARAKRFRAAKALNAIHKMSRVSAGSNPSRWVSVRNQRHCGCITGLTVALTVRTGCTQRVATGLQTSAPVTSSDTPVLPGSPEIDGPAYSGKHEPERRQCCRRGQLSALFPDPGD